MTDVLDGLGLGCLTVAGFLVASPLGFAVVGAGLLLVSRQRVRRGRR